MTSDELFALKPRLEAEARANKKLRRVERMHLLYGYANTYYKCRLYGVSHGAATDWRVSYVACGRFETTEKGAA